MRHPYILVSTVLTACAAYYLGLTGLLLAVAAALVCGMLALVLGLCVVAAGADRDAARAIDSELHEGEAGL